MASAACLLVFGICCTLISVLLYGLATWPIPGISGEHEKYVLVEQGIQRHYFHSPRFVKEANQATVTGGDIAAQFGALSVARTIRFSRNGESFETKLGGADAEFLGILGLKGCGAQLRTLNPRDSGGAMPMVLSGSLAARLGFRCEDLGKLFIDAEGSRYVLSDVVPVLPIFPYPLTDKLEGYLVETASEKESPRTATHQVFVSADFKDAKGKERFLEAFAREMKRLRSERGYQPDLSRFELEPLRKRYFAQTFGQFENFGPALGVIGVLQAAVLALVLLNGLSSNWQESIVQSELGASRIHRLVWELGKLLPSQCIAFATGLPMLASILPMAASFLSDGSLRPPSGELLFAHCAGWLSVYIWALPAIIGILLAWRGGYLSAERDRAADSGPQSGPQRQAWVLPILGMQVVALSLLTYFFGFALQSLSPVLPLLKTELGRVQSAEASLQIPDYLEPVKRIRFWRGTRASLGEQTRSQVGYLSSISATQALHSAACEPGQVGSRACLPVSLIVGEETAFQILGGRIFNEGCAPFEKAELGATIQPAYLDVRLAGKLGLKRGQYFEVPLLRAYRFQYCGDLEGGYLFDTGRATRVLIPPTALPLTRMYWVAAASTQGGASLDDALKVALLDTRPQSVVLGPSHTAREWARIFLPETLIYGGAYAVALIATFLSVSLCFHLIYLTRLRARSKEFGIRVALGAGKADLVRSLLGEFAAPALLAAITVIGMGLAAESLAANRSSSFVFLLEGSILAVATTCAGALLLPLALLWRRISYFSRSRVLFED